jgi:ribosome-binding factor A
VTVTAVRAGADIGQATVYVSVLGNARKRASAMSALERARGLLQQRIARELHFKRTPLLTFRYDETTDRALRLSELIDEGAPTADDPR